MKANRASSTCPDLMCFSPMQYSSKNEQRSENSKKKLRRTSVDQVSKFQVGGMRQPNSPLVLGGISSGETLAQLDDDLEGTTVNGKQIISVNRLRAMKPAAFDPAKELTSSGFIVFLAHCQANLKAVASRYSKKIILREHTVDRFVTTGMKMDVGKYDTNSVEARTAAVNVQLNRVSHKNMSSVIDDILASDLPHKVIIDLLLNRATSDIANAEKNMQLKIFAELVAGICRLNLSFRDTFRSIVIAHFNETISDASLSLNAKQCLTCWIAHLLIFWVISRREFFGCLEHICNQDKSQASEIIRCALWVAGAEIDTRKYYEVATFYKFIENHQCSQSYAQFLVQDLIELRDNDWNDVDEPAQRKKAASISDTDVVDLEEELSAKFMEWYNSEDAEVPDVDVPTFDILVLVTFRLMKKMSKYAADYTLWAGKLWKSRNPKVSEVSLRVKAELQKYAGKVIENCNPNMWYIVFQFLASLYSLDLLPLEFVLNSANPDAYPRDCPLPPFDHVLEKMGEICYFREEHVSKLIDRKELREPESRVILVMLTEEGKGDPLNMDLREAIRARDVMFNIYENNQQPESSDAKLLQNLRNKQPAMFSALCERILTPEQRDQLNL